MLELIQQYPLAALIQKTESYPEADHLPLVANSDISKLQGHISKSSPLALRNKTTDALAIFQGPNHYISPSWCKSKKDDNKIVPTWNYVAVHVIGKLRVVEDRSWLLSHLEQLTDKNEGNVSKSWRITDSPEEYVSRLSSYIVGVELQVENIVGRWKTAIVKPEINLNSVVSELEQLSSLGASEMANLIKERYKNAQQ